MPINTIIRDLTRVRWSTKLYEFVYQLHDLGLPREVGKKTKSMHAFFYNNCPMSTKIAFLSIDIDISLYNILQFISQKYPINDSVDH